METEKPPTPDLYFDTIFAFQRSAALKAAIDVDLFTAIGGGARTPKDLAAACGIPERSARILADYLTIVGFVVKIEWHLYAHARHRRVPDGDLADISRRNGGVPLFELRYSNASRP